MKRARRLISVAAMVVALSAHVGSPNVYFEGNAGPYAVRVIVRAAAVVPGQADITVRVLSGGRPDAVTVVPVYWDPRTAAPPPADTARLVPGDSLLYSAQLWLMTGGSYAVRVTVSGAAGSGMVNVPVQAVATRRLEMGQGMALGLGAIAAFLVIGLITIARAAARESVVPPGEPPAPRNRRHGRIATGIATAGVGIGLFLGRGWWNDVDRAYQRTIYRPTGAHASLGSDGRFLLTLNDAVRDRRWTPFIPDHGHLMHLFLVRSDVGAFAHLHPVPTDSNTFATPLPPLPAGPYRVYADLVHESGFSETVRDSVDLAAPKGEAGDPDDGWWVAPRVIADTVASLGDGATMVWHRGAGPMVVGTDARLEFSVAGPSGKTAELQPYMGMAGHAVIVRDDGEVFVHLHPMGTISWAAQQTFVLRTAADTLAGSVTRKLVGHDAMAHEGGLASNLAFPYSFPSPGSYRIWVQVKRGGRILTAAFSTLVTEPPGRLPATRSGT